MKSGCTSQQAGVLRVAPTSRWGLLVPQSAFEGIILVHSLQVSRNKRGNRLVIVGGDAGVAYRADYQIVPSIRIKGHGQ